MKFYHSLVNSSAEVPLLFGQVIICAGQSHHVSFQKSSCLLVSNHRYNQLKQGSNPIFAGEIIIFIDPIDINLINPDKLYESWGCLCKTPMVLGEITIISAPPRRHDATPDQPPTERWASEELPQIVDIKRKMFHTVICFIHIHILYIYIHTDMYMEIYIYIRIHIYIYVYVHILLRIYMYTIIIHIHIGTSHQPNSCSSEHDLDHDLFHHGWEHVRNPIFLIGVTIQLYDYRDAWYVWKNSNVTHIWYLCIYIYTYIYIYVLCTQPFTAIRTVYCKYA